MSVCPQTTTVNVGKQLSIVVTWQNTGTQAHTFIVLVMVGDYDPTSGTFSYLFMNKVTVATSPGQQYTTEVPLGVITSGMVRTDPYRIAAAILESDESAAYDQVMCNPILTISA
jgi:hypothetical protein